MAETQPLIQEPRFRDKHAKPGELNKRQEVDGAVLFDGSPKPPSTPADNRISASSVDRPHCDENSGITVTLKTGALEVLKPVSSVA